MVSEEDEEGGGSPPRYRPPLLRAVAEEAAWSARARPKDARMTFRRAAKIDANDGAKICQNWRSAASELANESISIE